MAAAAAELSMTAPVLQPFTAAIASPTNGRYDGSFATAAMGHRGEERAVGLDEQAVQRAAAPRPRARRRHS